jgi:hypothetical protein
MTLRSLAISLILLVACSSSHSDVSGSGTIAGVGFTAIAGIASGPLAAGEVCGATADGGVACVSTGQESLTVTFTNKASFACGDSASNFALLDTLVVNVTEGGSIGPGSYAIGTGANGASAAFSTTTASCGNGVTSAATGGSVTVTSMAGGHVSGNVSLMFGSSPFTGTFDVESCTSADGGPPPDAGLPINVTTCER